MLSEQLEAEGVTVPNVDASKRRLAGLGRCFQDRPLRVGVVTSSIRYEADGVLNEVFAAIRDEIDGWPAAREVRDRFEHPADYYDAIVTAGDSSEIRLKPHRDLYSIALHRLGVSPGEFDKVVGFEDSESGTVSIRAAGIGRCIGVPFKETSQHDLSYAARVLRGRLAEAVLCHNCFLKH